MSAVGAIFPRSAGAPPQQFANLSARALEPSAVLVLPFDALRRALAVDHTADAERSHETLRRLVQMLVVRLYRVTFLALYKYLALSEQLLDTVRQLASSSSSYSYSYRHMHSRAAHPPTPTRTHSSDQLPELNWHLCFRRASQSLVCFMIRLITESAMDNINLQYYLKSTLYSQYSSVQYTEYCVHCTVQRICSCESSESRIQHTAFAFFRGTCARTSFTRRRSTRSFCSACCTTASAACTTRRSRARARAPRLLRRRSRRARPTRIGPRRRSSSSTAARCAVRSVRVAAGVAAATTTTTAAARVE